MSATTDKPVAKSIQKMTSRGLLSLRYKLVLASLLSCAIAGTVVWLCWHYLALDSVISAALLGLGVCFLLVMWLTRKLDASLQSLEIGLLNLKDNEFSAALHTYGEPQLDAIAELYNHAAAKMRDERQYIYQRELMLDKVIQNSPNVMMLVDDHQRILYANDAARHLFNKGVRIEGMALTELVVELPQGLRQALASEQEGLFAVHGDDADADEASAAESLNEAELERWHISRGSFNQNNQQHHLILLKQLTKELNRQEVAVWKKVIRIISHELNNSVAPIASMVNSGRLLTKDQQNSKLELIFDTIESRTSHLSQFISHYAQFAKLPLPDRKVVDWAGLVAQLQQQYRFRLLRPIVPELLETQMFESHSEENMHQSQVGQNANVYQQVLLDSVQLEQVLINLLKNAHESGSSPDEITLDIRYLSQPMQGVLITLDDAGSGMPSEVLAQALLPFYSTKQSGTGIGLPLCREIVEAHGGHMSMKNREQGGLSVSLWLPIAH
ncbi:sensor histidine kinase [Shewanella maritima]|uniref:sensor histidine kinase n=1 Tax=Shewanella maritima TaxID=2520507 RepID=UPI00373638D1